MIKKNSLSLHRIIALLILLAIPTAIILYQLGYYDIAFIERPSGDISLDASESEGEVAAPETTTADTAPDTTAGETATPSDTSSAAESTSTPEEVDFLASLSSSASLKKRGYKLDGGDYSTSTRLATFDFSNAPKNAYSLSTATYSGDRYNEDTNSVEDFSETYDRPVVELYMGMIFVDDGSTVGLVGDDGVVKMVGFEKFEYAYERDEYERPLITADGGYYYVGVDSDGKYKLNFSSFNPAFGYPVRHESQIGYNEANCGLYLYYKEATVQYIANAERIYKMEKQAQKVVEPDIQEETVKLYGYTDKDGNVVIEAQYYYAFNFGPDGYAVVADRDRIMRVIDTKGREVINPYGTVIRQKDRNNSNAIVGYYLAEENGANSIGMYFFDRGFMRVRCALRNYFDIGQIVGDTDLLITPSGKQFEIPDGYELKSYSDGILLLEREGRYGCMDITGRWIAQPIYTSAEPFYEGLCVLTTADGKSGMIDTEGNVVIPFEFDHVSNASSGRIAVYDAASGWTVLEKLSK